MTADNFDFFDMYERECAERKRRKDYEEGLEDNYDAVREDFESYADNRPDNSL